MIPEDLHIPGYDFEALLGTGGMATVYRARQHTFDRDVALKILSPDLSEDGDFSQRFIQESLIVAKLHHSNIVQVYDVGEYDGRFYFAMEYLHGGSLSSKLKQGTLGVDGIVAIIRQIASALDFAHRKQIIHRDIKPDNIMFREDGATVITDFGIAKQLGADLNLTQDNQVIGTPNYMSPEQIKGQALDHRVDIYALGILFYRCLVGKVPFDCPDYATTIYKHLNEAVPSLPQGLRSLQPILNRMLEKAPEQRFSSAGDVVAALDALDLDSLSKVNVSERAEATVVLSEQITQPVEPESTRFIASSESYTERPTKVSVARNEASKPLASAPLGAGRKRFPIVWFTASSIAASGVLATFYLLNVNKSGPSSNEVDISKFEVAAEAPVLNAEPETTKGLSESQQLTIDRLIGEAQADIAAKRLKTPHTNNAFNKLQRILDLQPEHGAALAAMDQIAEEYAKMAEAQLANNKLASAEKYLQEARSIAPGLHVVTVIAAKLDAQQRQKQSKKDSITFLEQHLAVQGLLESAAIAESEGNLFSPKGDSAAEKYERVLQIDPDHSLAKQKLAELNNKLGQYP